MVLRRHNVEARNGSCMMASTDTLTGMASVDPLLWLEVTYSQNSMTVGALLGISANKPSMCFSAVTALACCFGVVSRS